MSERLSAAKRLFWATRPPFLTISVVGCLIGFAQSYAAGAGLSLGLSLLALVIALVAQASANVINDYCDSQNGSDTHNHERISPFTGGSRAIQDQWLTESQVKAYGYALLAACALLGLGLVIHLKSWGLIGLGALGLALAWGYSASPLKLMSRGALGEMAIVAAWALIVIGCAMVNTQTLSWAAVMLGLAFGAMVANILYMNQIPDIPADRAAKKLTLAVVTPAEKLWVWYAVFMLLGFALVVIGVWLRLLPLYCLACWLALPLLLGAQRTIQRSPADRAAMTWGIQKNIAGAHLFGMLLVAGLVLGRFGV